MGEQLNALREILAIGTAPGEFKPSEFFAHLDCLVPRRFRPHEHQCVPAHAICRFRDDVEESDKVIFPRHPAPLARIWAATDAGESRQDATAPRRSVRGTLPSAPHQHLLDRRSHQGNFSGIVSSAR